VQHVFGAALAATPVIRASHDDVLLQRTVRGLAERFGSTSGIYVEDLATGAGAAWNARATFPGASALKLAIAVTALARTEGTPSLGSTLDGLLRQMLTYSDNEAANQAETYFGGSTSGGSYQVNALMQSLGLVDTEMYGGYELDAVAATARELAAGGGIPLQVDSQPYWRRGKRTSAHDLGSLLRGVWLASGGRGPLRTAQPGFTVPDARYLLYLLGHVQDPGKIDRVVGRLPGVRVLHKAGWIDGARHDNGIVLWPGGAILVTVMTYRSAGAGLSSDVLAGDVAAAALKHFRR
jgi:beta-lactamase class A